MNKDKLNYKVRLGVVIRAVRIESGLSQEDMAHKTAINSTYYSKIERGENSVGIDKLSSISATLCIPLSKLFKMAEEIDL